MIQLIAGALGTTYRGHLSELVRDLDEGNVSGLYETVQWAYERLRPAEQRLFTALSVFVRGWDLPAARAVCGSDKILPLLTPLIHWGLVRRLATGEGYRMLDTERAFAKQKLGESGEGHEIRSGHLAYYSQFGTTAVKGLRTHRAREWLKRLDVETANIREAIRFALEEGDSSQGMALAGVMWLFWTRRGMHQEGLSYCQRLLEKAGPSESPLARATCLDGAGHLLFAMGDLQGARDSHLESHLLRVESGDEREAAQSLLQVARCKVALGALAAGRRDALESYCISKRSGDRHVMASCLLQIGRIWSDRGNPCKGFRLQRRALPLLQEIGDDFGRAWHLCYLTSQLIETKHLEEAAETSKEANRIFEEHGDFVGAAWCVMHDGLIAWRQGSCRRARPLLEEAEEMFKLRGYEEGLGATLTYLGHVALDEENWAEACGLLNRALDIFTGLQRSRTVCWVLSQLARCAAGKGDYPEAARLLGVCKRIRKDVPSKPYIPDRARLARAIWDTRAVLGSAEFRRLRQGGFSDGHQLL